MSNPTQEYNDYIRANLPYWITYDEDRARYVTWNGKYFPTYLEAKWYSDYIIKFGADPSPLSLFANGEQGAWYDPSDLSTLYQDAAGTTPVTADGDPVGYMADKSGNGNHATQSTAAARPVYRTDGTLHWLEFDGVDDFLEHEYGTVIGETTADYTSFTAFQLNTASTTQIPGRGTDGSGTGSGNANFDLIHCYADNSDGFYRSNGSQRLPNTDIATEFGDPPEPAIVMLSKNGTIGIARTNGIERQNIAVNNELDTFSATSDWKYRIGANGGFFGAKMSGKLFARMLVVGTLTSQEIAKTESYLASKSGVTL